MRDCPGLFPTKNVGRGMKKCVYGYKEYSVLLIGYAYFVFNETIKPVLFKLNVNARVADHFNGMTDRVMKYTHILYYAFV